MVVMTDNQLIADIARFVVGVCVCVCVASCQPGRYLTLRYTSVEYFC